MSKLSEYRKGTDSVPKTMQAVVLSGSGFENLSVREVPVPDVGPDQLLCRVDAAGVCTSILKLIAQGSSHTFINGWDLAKNPIILGDEGSVTVVKVGSKLSGKYRVGQRYGIQPAVDVEPINHRERYQNSAANMRKCAVGYTLPGHLAQYMLVQEEVLTGGCLLPLPDENLAYFAVSMAEPISCIYSAQERQFHIYKESPLAPRVAKLGLLPGGNAVVIGAGPMGLMHAELALRYRPRNLLICDKLPARLKRANETLGAKARKAGVNLLTVESAALKETLTQVSNGTMADDLVLAVGIQPVQQQALELLGKGGVANLFGGLPQGQHMLQINAIAVHYDEIKVVGSSGGAPSDMAATLDAIAKNDIDPGNYVFGYGGLQHAPQVLRMIKENLVEGKVILYPHARIEQLTTVDHWDKPKEEKLLSERL
ncbi:MAG TPA: alcohol dehydrogenase catalytic domain-containing protein [Planctomycetota bacterium]|jgi:threonine dehydrogenase-like Zn-dependent dehydrogenase